MARHYKKGEYIIGKIIEECCDGYMVQLPSYDSAPFFLSKKNMYIDNLTNLYIGRHVGLEIKWKINDENYGFQQYHLNSYRISLDKKKKKENVLRQEISTLLNIGEIYDFRISEVAENFIKILVLGIEETIIIHPSKLNRINSIVNNFYVNESIKVRYMGMENNTLKFEYNDDPQLYPQEWYDLDLGQLLNKIGIKENVFVGQAIQINGEPYLINVRTEENGDLLQDILYGPNIRVKVSSNENVKYGEYYKGNLNLLSTEYRKENNFLFGFEIENIELVDDPYQKDVKLVYQKQENPNANSRTAKLLAEVGSLLYKSKQRMFFELLQNADDAAIEDGAQIEIDGNESYISFRHNGLNFSKEDFKSLTSAANSTKKDKSRQTGYKGIGFKSVFSESTKVIVHSGGYHFMFDKLNPTYIDFDKFYKEVREFDSEGEKQRFYDKFRDEYRDFRGIEDIPWQLLPLWCSDKIDNKYNVSFLLSIAENKENSYIDALNKLFEVPRFILFLRNTKSVSLKYANQIITKQQQIVKDSFQNHTRLTIKNSYLPNSVEQYDKVDYDDILINNESFIKENIDLEIRDCQYGDIVEPRFYRKNGMDLSHEIPNKLATSSSVTISFVAKYNNGVVANDMQKETSLYTYLPLDEHRFIFPFFINADFILGSNREQLQYDNPWNQYLMVQIGRLVVDWVAKLSLNKEKNSLGLLPNLFSEDTTDDSKVLARHFNKSYKQALIDIPFILTEDDCLAKQSDVIYDDSGISDIIGSDIFYQFVGTERKLPSNDIETSVLKSSIFEDIQIIKKEDVESLLPNSEIIEDWLQNTTDDNVIAFCNWIKENVNDNDVEWISRLPLIRFDGGYKSIENLEDDEIIMTDSLNSCRDIICSMNFNCSVDIIEEHPLYDYFQNKINNIEKVVFGKIINKLSDYSFSNKAKERLFCMFERLSGIGDESLKQILLFKNKKGDCTQLGKMTQSFDNLSTWLFPYVIEDNEYFNGLDKYLINEDQLFEKIIKIHYKDILKNVGVRELYVKYKENICNDNDFICNIIDICDDIDLIDIVKDRDKKVRIHFLEHINSVQLLSDNKYTKDSYENKILELANDTLNDESIEDFAKKVYFNNVCIVDEIVSDKVYLSYTNNLQKLELSLSKILPNRKKNTVTIEDIIYVMPDLSENVISRIFNPRSLGDESIYEELVNDIGCFSNGSITWASDMGNASQYLFLLYYTRGVKCYHTYRVPHIDLAQETNIFINDLMDIFYEQQKPIIDPPFCYRLNVFYEKYFDSKYLFDSERLLNSIEIWADNVDKKEYLKKQGVVDPNKSYAIKCRKDFMLNHKIDYLNSLSNIDISHFLQFIVSKKNETDMYSEQNQIDFLKDLKDLGRKIQLSSPYNWGQLQNHSNEYERKTYSSWSKERNIKIYIYQYEEIPMYLMYNNHYLISYNEGSYAYIYDENKRIYYIYIAKKSDKTVESVLYNLTSERRVDFSIQDWNTLILEGSSIVENEELELLQSQLNQYKARYGELNHEETLNDKESEIKEGGEIVRKGKLSSEEQKEKNREVRISAKNFLENKEYDCSLWDPDSSGSLIEDCVITPEGVKIPIAITSSDAGYIHLSTWAVSILMSTPNALLLNSHNGRIGCYTYEDIFKNNPNINIVLDASIVSSDLIEEAADLLEGDKTMFVIKNPSYSACTEIKSFNLDKRNDGEVDINVTDDDIR